jgi:hypothetical protein
VVVSYGISARTSLWPIELARNEVFNDEISEFVPSYDGRNREPITLPCKLPLLLMLGTEGIAVGMWGPALLTYVFESKKKLGKIMGFGGLGWGTGIFFSGFRQGTPASQGTARRPGGRVSVARYDQGLGW